MQSFLSRALTKYLINSYSRIFVIVDALTIKLVVSFT